MNGMMTAPRRRSAMKQRAGSTGHGVSTVSTHRRVVHARALLMVADGTGQPADRAGAKWARTRCAAGARGSLRPAPRAWDERQGAGAQAVAAGAHGGRVLCLTPRERPAVGSTRCSTRSIARGRPSATMRSRACGPTMTSSHGRSTRSRSATIRCSSRSSSTVSVYMSICQRAATTLVNRLVDEGYVERSSDPRDRRAALVRIPPLSEQCSANAGEPDPLPTVVPDCRLNTRPRIPRPRAACTDRTSTSDEMRAL